MKKSLRNLSLAQWYIVLLSVSILTIIITLFATHGELFSGIFFTDSLDTGMDFFHSIEYTKGRAPYLFFDTLYPPLANLFYYVLYLFVPDWQSDTWATTFEKSIAIRGTASDLRVWQPTFLLFILYTVVVILLLCGLIHKMFNQCALASALAFCSVFSYGVLWAVERGNIIILCLVLVLFFVLYRNASSPILREIALFSLACAAGLKIYPALFGILLLYDKEYKQALRAIIYGILAFVLPCFVFREGIDCIPYFLNVLFSWTNGGMIMEGLSFNKICASFMWIINSLFNTGIDLEVVSDFMEKFNIIFSGMLLLLGFRAKKEWHRLLVCSLAIILFQKQSLYIVAFLLVPLLQLIKEEKKISVQNFVPFCALIGTQMIVPIKASSDLIIIFTNVRMQLLLVVLVGYACFILFLDHTIVIKKMPHYPSVYIKINESTKEFGMKKTFLQFVKFGIVGLSNTIISYITYVILVLMDCNYLLASVIGFVISVINSFYWNNKYVFKDDTGKRELLKTFVKTFFAYASTGLLLANILLYLWIDILHLHEMLGPILNLFITIPINFVLNKLWAFKKKNE